MSAEKQFAGIVERVTAAASNVMDPYFNLKVAGTEGPILRERVYAYELYHQLRCLRPHEAMTLTAEPDKSGHREITDDSNPDFVFHTPGTMAENLALLEVKRAISTDGERDLTKFRSYLSNHNYRYCIWLVFGPLDDAKFTTRFVEPFREFGARGCLLRHRSSGSAPEVVR